METRSRKRAGGAAAAAPSSRAVKRSRTAAPAITTRSRSLRSSFSGSAEREKQSSRKGKEKAMDGSREREGQAERILGQSIDTDSEDGTRILPSSSALQGLLRKLGNGLEGLLPSSAVSGRLKKILAGLRANGEEQRQIEALTELCTMLSIGQGESLSPFPVDSFVPVLVGLLNQESNPEMMLLAARALTYLCDILPSSCSAVVQYGAVSSFCARLLTIEFMDLAEQSLQALKKISQEHPSACLRAGALMAVLSYLDFFPTGVQRLALSTAANICKKLPSDAVDFVMEAVPLLLNLLQHHDSKVLEDASVCLTRITEAFSSSPEQLDELCNHGLVKQAADLLTVNGQTSLSGPTYTGLTRLLSTCASGSPFGAKTLHLLGISGILKDIFSRSGNVSGSTVSLDQILEIVNLADELLPVLPRGTKGSNEISAQEELFRDQPELLLQFGLDLLPVLIQVHGSSVNSQVRHKCLSVICKLMYFSTVDMIKSLVAVTNISSFLASVLVGKDPQILIQALQMSDILMEKLPEVFSKTFVREGVLHAVGELVVLTDSAEIAADRSSRLHAQCYRRQISGIKRDGSISIGFDIVSIRSKVFMEKYFHGDLASAEVCGTEDFQHLRNLCTRLNAMVKESQASSEICSSNASEAPFEEIMSEMLRGLSREDGVSTFEFIQSAAVTSFLNYFSFGSFSKEKVPNANLPELRRMVLRRYRSFISISLSRNPNSGIEDVPSAMTVLIRKLQGALSSMESFPLVLSSSSGVLKALTRLRKIQFRRSEEEKSLADFSSNIVVIDPFENLAAVEEFLWPRIQPSDPAKESSSSSSASEKKAGLSAEKGKAVLSSGSDDFVGSRTRSAARRRAISSPSKPLSEDEFEFPPVEIELMSDDEDIFSEDEDQFHEEMLRDNFIHIYSPDEVLEVNQSQSSASKSSGCDQPKLKFFSDGRELGPHLTVIQAIHSQLEEEDDDITFRKSKICTITYQKATDITIHSTINNVSELPSASISLLDSLFQGELPCNLEKSNGSYDILALLRVLEGINQLVPRLRAEMVAEEFAQGKVVELVDCCDTARVPAKEFINSKLASKLSKQSKDEAVQMTRGMPPWCKQLAQACPFLFPFEVRREFCAAEMWRRHPRRRQKVRVSRDRVLECAAAVMEVCSSEDCVLDVEFSGEVGTGLGPTLEFYTILSRELQREELGLWRCGKSQGLFPRPWKQNSGSLKVLEYFSLLGRFMGKAIQDGRLLDLPLSAVFYKFVLGEELDVYDVMMFDRELGRSLLEMKALVRRKRLSEEGRLATGVDLRFRGTPVEDLCIDFMLPGYPGYPLREDLDKLVDIESLEEYVELVVDATVGGGIRQQMEAFREGFNRVFDISSLCIFTPEELDCLICGRRELWQAETLAENIKFDHGFTSKSPAITNFLEILGEFTPEQQQAFCQFVTGAPRLPSGGLATLSPKLTVVRKHSSGGALNAASDFSDDLPSVMTCANYLKLPAYSTKEIMYEKLMYAINEGQGSFDLS